MHGPHDSKLKDYLNLFICFMAFSICGETQIFEFQWPIKFRCRVARIGDQKNSRASHALLSPLLNPLESPTR